MLKTNPLLINKIIAEKLSDKIQLMMVPTDSKFFFANDVFRGMETNQVSPQADTAGRSSGTESLSSLSPLARGENRVDRSHPGAAFATAGAASGLAVSVIDDVYHDPGKRAGHRDHDQHRL